MKKSQAANSITVTHCGCNGGTVHLQLRDKQNRIFATASMGVFTALNFRADVVQNIDAAARHTDCKGHA